MIPLALFIAWLTVTVVCFIRDKPCHLLVIVWIAQGAEFTAGWLVRVAGFLRAGRDTYYTMREKWYREAALGREDL